MQASCQCGAIAFKTPLPKPLAVYICHCLECRRQSSSAFGCSAIFPAFPLPKSTRDGLAVYSRPTASGHQLNCFFCRTCGTRLIHSTPGKDVVSVKGGCIEGLDWESAKHIWCKSAMVPIPEGVERYEEEPANESYDLTGSGAMNPSSNTQPSSKPSIIPTINTNSKGAQEVDMRERTTLEEEDEIRGQGNGTGSGAGRSNGNRQGQTQATNYRRGEHKNGNGGRKVNGLRGGYGTNDRIPQTGEQSRESSAPSTVPQQPRAVSNGTMIHYQTYDSHSDFNTVSDNEVSMSGALALNVNHGMDESLTSEGYPHSTYSDSVYSPSATSFDPSAAIVGASGTVTSLTTNAGVLTGEEEDAERLDRLEREMVAEREVRMAREERDSLRRERGLVRVNVEEGEVELRGGCVERREGGLRREKTIRASGSETVLAVRRKMGRCSP